MASPGQHSRPLFETEFKDVPAPLPPSAGKWEWQIVWWKVIILTALHIGAVYGAYLILTKAMLATNLFAAVLNVFAGLGITAGVHRLWTHKAYKARLPLRLILVFLNTLTFQDTVLAWARDHRMHHKYSETDADPYNATRGFFFSHVGWLMVKKHPEFKAKAHTIDMSDLWADPILRFQKKYYMLLMPLACFILPTYIPTLWGESAWNAFFVCAVSRVIYALNVTWLVNSGAHKWGTKPYEKSIVPVENKLISFVTLGEGFHNYHHIFPWDYKTGELGQYSLNITTLFIDAMAKIGWAYDLKTVSADVIEKRVKRTGDGSHEEWGHRSL